MSTLSDVVRPSGASADASEVRCLHPEHVLPLLGDVLSPAEAEELASIFALLADPTRARVVHALSMVDELCVCDLAALVGVTPSALSHQMRLLRARRVVARRKIGRVVYYSLADAHVRHVFDDGLQHLRETGVDERERPA